MIAIGSGVFTPEGYADALSKFGQSIRPAILRSLKRDAAIPRSIYIAAARRHGVVRSVFGKNPKGMFGLVRTKVADKGSSFVLALEMRGLVALQEVGGRTKPPKKGAIYPLNRKALKLKVPSLGVVYAASAKHRGASIHRFPEASQALLKAAPRIQAGLDRTICEFRAGGVQIAVPGRVA